jgi:rhamnose utilization protein RhaD (predicted bifunctional aldolase and dehydrogenase)
MRNELCTHLFRHDDRMPSIEALVHAFLPARFIDHTHADAILALTNRVDGERVVGEALGGDVIVVPYVRPGFQLAKAAADAFERQPGARGMVWLHHGLVTWGETARASYETTIDLVSRAEGWLKRDARRTVRVSEGAAEAARERLGPIAPIVRGALGRATSARSRRPDRVILRSVITDEVVTWLSAPAARGVFVTAPLTSDHLIRTKAFPLWIDRPDYIPIACANKSNPGYRGTSSNTKRTWNAIETGCPLASLASIPCLASSCCLVSAPCVPGPTRRRQRSPRTLPSTR